MIVKEGLQDQDFLDRCCLCLLYTSKIRYTEDQLPWVDKAMAPPRKEGNYELLTEALSGSRIRYFDSIRYLEEHKSEFDSRVPLFYRTGLHWSVYVGNMTGAAFGEFLEQESGYNLPEMTITANPCENPVYPDADSFEVFNTIGKPYDQYYEPVIEITDEETDAPGFLCRGGSFMGQSPVSYTHLDVYKRQGLPWL